MFNTDDLLPQLPEAGHVLFKDSPNATTVGERDFEWQKYATGFCDAADHLVAHAIARGSMRDWLVFPVLALYRQSIDST